MSVLLGEVPPFAGMVEVVLDAADVAVQPADVAEVVVAEVLEAFVGIAAPLRHVLEGHVAVVVVKMFVGVFGENGLGGALRLGVHFAALEEAARIAVGGVFVVVGDAGQQAIDGAARVVVHVACDGAAEVLLVANVRVNADAPVEGVGSEGVFVIVVHVDGPAAGVRVDFVCSGVEHDTAVVFRVHGESQTDLFEIADARRGLGFCTCLGQRREQHGGENRDDGDDDEQFNQCEPQISG